MLRNLVRKWKEWLAKAKDEADQKLWDIEQDRRRESLEQERPKPAKQKAFF